MKHKRSYENLESSFREELHTSVLEKRNIMFSRQRKEEAQMSYNWREQAGFGGHREAIEAGHAGAAQDGLRGGWQGQMKNGLSGQLKSRYLNQEQQKMREVGFTLLTRADTVRIIYTYVKAK